MTTRPEPSPHSSPAHRHRSSSSGDDSDSAPPSRHPGRASMSAAQHHMQQLNPASFQDQQYDGGSSSDGGPAEGQRGRTSKAVRPAPMRRADSGSLIVTGGGPVEGRDEVYGSEDARTMSPRRSGEEVDRLGESARRALMQQAKELQNSLLEIVGRVESVKEEHEKLEGGNRFLQSYIGELMQTSKLTAAGAAGKGKAKGGRGKAAR